MKPTKPRILKVEEIGDHWNKKTYPRIRLKGLWLVRAGIQPNSQVWISNPQPGVLVIYPRYGVEGGTTDEVHQLSML